MKRIERYEAINALIRRYKYDRYLEVGTAHRQCFDRINVKSKEGVDPSPEKKSESIRVTTSDEFFDATNSKWDIIFIDGLHEEKQVDRDISNSLRCLSRNGTIAVHDCRPQTVEQTAEKRLRHGPWHGTVWKSFVKLRMTRTDLTMYVIDNAPMGIIRRGTQHLLPREDLTFEQFKNDEKYYLNLISVDEFLRKLTTPFL